MEKIIQEAYENVRKLENQNKLLIEKYKIAIQGLNAILDTCDTLGLSQKTLDEINKIENEPSDNENKNK